MPNPGDTMSPSDWNQAGGGALEADNWGPDISPNATDALYLLEFLDNILLEILYDGFESLNGGRWANAYPKRHRRHHRCHGYSRPWCIAPPRPTLSSDYKKPVHGLCQYSIPNENIDLFLHATLSVLLLEIGVLIDISSQLAATEPWLVPVLTSQVGAKSRMTAVVNMMQGHLAAAAVREAVLPSSLAWSYAKSNYIVNCPDTIASMPGNTWKPLIVTSRQQSADGSAVSRRSRSSWMLAPTPPTSSSPGSDPGAAIPTPLSTPRAPPKCPQLSSAMSGPS